MSLQLSIFTPKMMQSYTLPNISNADYAIVLDKIKFGFESNIVLEMQVIDDKWTFVKTSEYTIVRNVGDVNDDTLRDKDIFSIELTNKNIIKVSVSEVNISIENLKKYILPKRVPITIGRTENNVICYDIEKQRFISSDHAVISYLNNNWCIEDKSVNGVFINGTRIAKGQPIVLKICDIIEIYGLKIIFLGNIIAMNAENKAIIDDKILIPYDGVDSEEAVDNTQIKEKKYFHRSPRKKNKIYAEKIEIEAPPSLRKPEQRPLIMTIGPSLTMSIPMMIGCGIAILASRSSGMGASAFMYTGIITAVGSAIIGASWTMANLKYAKNQYEKSENARFEAYSKYLLDITEKIKYMYTTNAKTLNEKYPSAAECVLYNSESQQLWNRNITHEDIMYYRLGLGEKPFQTDISVPKEKFSLEYDELANKPRKIYDEYNTLYNIPIGVDLKKHRIVGIVGGPGKVGAFEILKCLSAQIAATNSYTDVKMVFVFDKEKEINRQWRFVKWFPHSWTEEKRGRLIASDKKEASDLFFELTNVLRIRNENSLETFSSNKEVFVKPHYVLFIDDISWLEGEPIAKYLYENKPEYGITTILMAEKYSDLPNRCDYVIYNDSEFKGIYDITDNIDGQKIGFDAVSVDQLDDFSRKLMKIEIEETEMGAEIVSSLDFFEMYGIKKLDEFNVNERWKKNRTYESMKALIGKKAGGSECYLDVHEKYHGPHGLVAGTTGSGKSETLQTYMLSLAINFSPDDIAFFIIDFKGGGMANLFCDLPHSIGQISNLSGNQVRRAMLSIKSENKRRQRIFSENGVNNINNYTRLVKNKEATLPIPHLFIIIDEFAELKKEEPEFMKELISVAQVGRSLGVHLILATQKPSGTVDDNIWSNSKFRLCLRVQDKQDSKDMLHKPDAAYITQAGRGYLQVGNDEVYECFQSGWSGAPFVDDDSVTSDIVTLIGLNGKAEMVGNKLRLQQKETKRREWITFLVNTLTKMAEKCGISLEEYHTNTSVAENILCSTIECIHKSGIKYEDNNYNRGRMDDLISIWKSVRNTDDPIKEIIQISEISGKRLPEMKEITQLDAVIEYLSDVAKKNNYTKSMQLWLPCLPEKFYLEDIKGYKACACSDEGYKKLNQKEWELEAFIGLYDDPANQAQEPVTVNFAKSGHLAVCGTVVSGKSTFLQTLIYSLMNRYSAEYINFYLLDFSSKMMSAFDGSNHVGGVMYESDTEKIAKFFNMITTIFNERKELFKGGNYSQYVRVNGTKLPAIMIIIDNYEGFRSKTNGAYDDLILKLSSESVSYGIYLVMSSGGFGTNEIPNSLVNNIKNTISLEMSDKFKYAQILKVIRTEIMPEANIKGRGLVCVNDGVLEFQTALALEAEDDYARINKIKQRCEFLNSLSGDAKAKRIPEIPKNPVWDDIVAHEDFDKVIKDDIHLPIGYNTEDASLFSIDLSSMYTYIISGKRKTGKTNMLRIMAHSFAAKGSKICIIDSSGSMRSVAENVGAELVTNEDELCTYLEKLIKTFIERNRQKKQLVSENKDEMCIYNTMLQHERIVVLIHDFEEFLDTLAKPLKNSVYDFYSVMNNLIEKGYLHNIYFVAAGVLDNVNNLNMNKVYRAYTNDKNGILLGGNAAGQKLFDFSDIKFAEQNKTYKPGIGLVPTDEGTCKIAIPKVH